ncbi:DUF6298 domain-containing protein [Novipirellula artificiosorum]|uniref:DUF6298 domain-containing protein n=1 Tax=Novipirellula artificiosorum TaxID=2528016 RepID=A0A5C6DZ34_9BACT|nr:DUF6298 domain-containing protein [Novipirellula artificiosorum]TWU41908.1 hypothetical protein Poly41_02010 [Novipirellula artificiosorum]
MTLPTVRSALLALLFSATLSTVATTQAIEPWDENPWHWSQHGQPVMLLGGSDDDSLFQWPEQTLVKQLDRIAAAGGNLIRNTMSDRSDKGFELYPFRKLANGMYDLTQWNDEYWERFERMLAETKRRSIFVQIEVWDRFDYTDSGKNSRGSSHWQDHPYNPANNVNYSFEESGFEKRYPDHPGQNKQPFFFTTPKQRNNKVVLAVQQAFVNKMLDHALPYEHVLYCIDNETNGEAAWAEYWAEFMHRRASAEGKQIMVTEMWDDWDLTAKRHRQTFDRSDLYAYVDVSQNNHNKGQKHWDNFLFVRNYLTSKPRPMNTTKTYGADGNKFKHTDQDAIERFWRHLLAGAASIRFHRPDSGLGINDKAVACIQAARAVESLVPFWSVDPANELLTDRSENEAYLATNADRSIAVVYFPASDEDRSVQLDTQTESTSVEIRWIGIDRDGKQYDPTIESAASSRLKLVPPIAGNMVAVVRQR